MSLGDHTRQYSPTIAGIRPDHTERYKFAAELLAGKSVIDAACGCGYGSWMMQEAGCKVTGIDIEPEAIDYAKTHYVGPEYICSDITQCIIPTADSVVSFETLEHLVDPEPTIKRFHGAAPMLIASVPNEEMYPFRPENFAGDKYPHQRHYLPKQFEYLLIQCGWNVASKWCQKDKRSPVVKGTDGIFLIYVCTRDK